MSLGYVSCGPVLFLHRPTGQGWLVEELSEIFIPFENTCNLQNMTLIMMSVYSWLNQVGY